MRILEIDKKLITDNNGCYVIAEIGHNHGGNLATCKQMFKAAKDCGCDAVKLQKRDNRSLYTKAFYNQPYDNKNSYGRTYGEHREALEFGARDYLTLQDYAKKLDITFFATAFDHRSVLFLEQLEMPCYKTASADLTNIPHLRYIASRGKPMIISTGGATMDDIVRAFKAVTEYTDNFAILHCIASYPNRPEEVNLNIIKRLRYEFPDTLIGFSCHYNGIVMAEAAYMMGARVIEKHFTLDHTMKGTDHALSLQPDGMRRLVRDLKRLHSALGDGKKRILEREKEPTRKMAKAIYPRHSISEGSTLRAVDLAIRSPGGGLFPYEAESIIGKTVIIDLSTDMPIKEGDIK